MVFRFFPLGTLSYICSTKTKTMIEFLQWLEDNHWYRYKDGTYYTTNERPYIQGKQRKFYTREQVVDLFLLGV